jgi:glutathione S-transferase
MMKLYEFGPSRAIRVRWTLQELDAAFESIIINLRDGEQRTPEFLKINPAGRLPVLIDGDVVLTESVAIVLYLAEKYPAKRLIPSDLAARAQMYRWLLFAATELEQPLWRIARHSVIYPEDKRLPAEIALARQDFSDVAQVMEAHMRGRQFVVGDTVTAADFVLAYTLDWAKLAKTLNGFPVLDAYLERMYGRPKAPERIKDALARTGR